MYRAVCLSLTLICRHVTNIICDKIFITPRETTFLTLLLTLIFRVILWTRHVFENIDPKAIVNPMSKVNTLAWNVKKELFDNYV